MTNSAAVETRQPPKDQASVSEILAQVFVSVRAAVAVIGTTRCGASSRRCWST